ncbi:NADH-dependent [FeFe] hydrogenase, group A6 [Geothrix sp. 21YS21S-2]|uniref:NADH-dependent [FeFe] hydrogenase, group A6 n=1 Tax=Geothrix sp. 21YS21S-2 TaxID=3068893 RepID=UPI0027B8BF0D|nr:NADH-dependent [FeFe] hydrogenase, group A6 [Geothrix sp. 21YS21S-2]
MSTELPETPKRAPSSQLGQNLAVAENTSAIGGTVSISIDGQALKVPLGTTILDAAKRIGIKIPTLCNHPDLCVAGVCRICSVEVEGQRTLQAACAYPVTSPIKVFTHTRKVRMARRHIVDLMLSEHYGHCYACGRNNNCELQTLAKEYGVDYFRFGHPEKPVHAIDHSSYSVVRDNNKCVLCRRCVRTCIDVQDVGTIEVLGRGRTSHVSTFLEKPLGSVVCINCGQCINRCPTGALRANDPTDEVWEAIHDPKKHVVIQTAPSPRAAIGECFGQPAGKALTFELNTALRMCGFDQVFDTNFSADLTIMEEGTELLLRLKKALVDGEPAAFPQFTSCSPGWVKYLEHFYPEYIPNLSTAKSPQQMFGAVIKTYYAEKQGIDPKDIVTVALMPCSAKKFECNRPEMDDSGFKDVDYGLTTRELAKMISETGLDLPRLPKSDFDAPFGTATGSGVIFGATGGVMEAALRTVIELVVGVKVEDLFEHADIKPVRGFEGVKYVELAIPKVGPVPAMLAPLFPSWDFLKGATLKVAVAHGTANAKAVMEDIKQGGQFSQCHFIEFMGCPGGCLGGGGQPIPTSPEIRKARAQAIYAEDAAYAVRKSHENPDVLKIYAEYLTEGPCGHRSHKLLHTHYTERGRYIE